MVDATMSATTSAISKIPNFGKILTNSFSNGITSIVDKIPYKDTGYYQLGIGIIILLVVVFVVYWYWVNFIW